MNKYGFSAVAVCAGLLSACATGTSTVTNEAPVSAPAVVDEVLAPPEIKTPDAPIDGMAFPQLQGSWVRICKPFDPDEPDGSYERTTMTVSGDTLESETIVYSDSNCTAELERGFMQFGSSGQFNGYLERPAGSVDTSVGEAPLIDITIEETLIDNQPLDASVAGFFPVNTSYNIVHVDGDTMYLGVSDGNLDGDTPQTRPQQLDLVVPYTRQ